MKVIRLLAAMAASCLAGPAWTQSSPTPFIWEEFAQRIKASEKVQPLGPNFAGELVSLSNGGLSFEATDVSLPGNDALKVEFRRTYNVFSRKDYGDLGMLADWTVDVPSISGVFAPNWVLGLNKSVKRCTEAGIPRPADSYFEPLDFWQGLQINIPGISTGELLRTEPTVEKPSDGQAYYWVTNERVHVSCLASNQNENGEGFLARTPDGTRYWFNYMGQTREAATSALEHLPDGIRVMHTLARKKNFLYATRVEDRFGNYVKYTYSNLADEPGKLTRIEASDGRTLTIGYTGATISSVSDGTRTWRYAYASTSSGRRTLTAVTLPDNSAWTIELGPLTNAEIKFNEAPPPGEIMRTCTMNETPMNVSTKFTGKLTHPAGATAEFTLGIKEHGRSYVPINCRNVTTTFLPPSPKKGIDNNENDDVSLYATSGYGLTLETKKVYGPGLTEAVWSYTYQPNAYPPVSYGTTVYWPVCDFNVYDCEKPFCTDENCAKYSVTTVTGPGVWQRYRHGNSYRYNEGKLLKVETGISPDEVLRVENYAYDFSQLDKVYPAKFGRSLKLYEEGFASEFHRPQTASETIQQGTAFRRSIDEFDPAARPKLVTRNSAPTTTSDPPPPGISAPTLSAPANAVAGQAHDVSWSSVSGAVLYVLERSVGSDSFGTIYGGAGNGQSLIYPSAATLKYRLRACNAYGQCSAYSAIKTVTVSAPLSFAAPLLTAPQSARASSMFEVRWTAVAAAEKYILERKIGTSEVYHTLYTGPSLAKLTSFSTPGRLYFRVKACDAATNCGPYSSAVSTMVVDDQIEP